MAERVVLAFGNEQYAMPRLEAFTDGFATALELRGVRPGHRVALMSSNRPEFVMALRAIWRLGAAVVLMSPAWKRAEVDHALALTDPAHAVGDHPVLAELKPMLHLDEPIAPGQRTFEPPTPESEAHCWCSVPALRVCRKRCDTAMVRSPPRCGTGGVHCR
jgi:long-chain acyl-CoA synthetase